MRYKARRWNMRPRENRIRPLSFRLRFECELTTFLPLAVVFAFFTFAPAPSLATGVCRGCVDDVVVFTTVVVVVVVVLVLPPAEAVLAEGVDMIEFSFSRSRRATMSLSGEESRKLQGMSEVFVNEDEGAVQAEEGKTLLFGPPIRVERWIRLWTASRRSVDGKISGKFSIEICHCLSARFACVFFEKRATNVIGRCRSMP